MSSAFYYLIITVSAVFYGLLPILAKYTKDTVKPFAFMAITMLLLGVLSLVISLLTEHPFAGKALSMTSIYSLIAFALINMIGFWLYLVGVRHVPIANYELIALVTPLIAAVAAYFFLGEALAARFFIGLPIIAVGIWIAFSK